MLTIDKPSPAEDEVREEYSFGVVVADEQAEQK